VEHSVLFDLQVFAEQRHGGVSRYFRELSRALHSRRRWVPSIAPGLHVADVDASSGSIGPRLQIPSIPRTVRIIRGLNRWASSAARRRIAGHTEVYHPTWYHRPSIEAIGDLPFVITIHDMIPESWPAVTTPEQLLHRRWAIEHAAAILCVSEATGRDLLDRFDVADKVFIAHPGLTPLAPPTTAHRNGDPYFVYVGKRGSYKDFQTCLRAVGSARVGLVVIGGGPPGEGLRRQLASSYIGELVRLEPNPDDSRLAGLLQGARGLISTSRQEGFGIPPLEALSLGTPVILSDITVYREVYGDWARFFPVGDHEALTLLLRETIEAPPSLPSLEELASRFPWSATAEVAERAYERALL
jgi:glycosyltransferase involved in cell wall biosynthesis